MHALDPPCPQIYEIATRSLPHPFIASETHRPNHLLMAPPNSGAWHATFRATNSSFTRYCTPPRKRVNSHSYERFRRAAHFIVHHAPPRLSSIEPWTSQPPNNPDIHSPRSHCLNSPSHRATVLSHFTDATGPKGSSQYSDTSQASFQNWKSIQRP